MKKLFGSIFIILFLFYGCYKYESKDFLCNHPELQFLVNSRSGNIDENSRIYDRYSREELSLVLLPYKQYLTFFIDGKKTSEILCDHGKKYKIGSKGGVDYYIECGNYVRRTRFKVVEN
jgi:hypothetical protein